MLNNQNVHDLPISGFATTSLSRSRESTTDADDVKAFQELIISIQEQGLLQPVGATTDGTLIYGSRRVAAVKRIYNMGDTVLFGKTPLELGTIPTVIYPNDITEEEIANLEYAENAARQKLSHTDAARLTARLADFETHRQQAKAEQAVQLIETLGDAEKAEEVKEMGTNELLQMRRERRGDTPLTAADRQEDDQIRERALEITAKRQYNKATPGMISNVKADIKLNKAVEEDDSGALADILNHAKNKNAAHNVLQKQMEDKKNALLAQLHTDSYSVDGHNILNGNCLKLLAEEKDHSFDVCITDPPYGINAHTFNDASGKYSGVTHEYDDSPEAFIKLLPKFLNLLNKKMKADAHVYIACDLRHYHKLRHWLMTNNTGDNLGDWHIPNNPIIQIKKYSGRVVHPGYTFRNNYEVWLYAYRGERKDSGIYEATFTSDASGDGTVGEAHGARKPRDLLEMFVRRSCKPGDKILDAFAGQTLLLEVAHSAKCKVTLMEMNATYYGKLISRQKLLNQKRG